MEEQIKLFETDEVVLPEAGRIQEVKAEAAVEIGEHISGDEIENVLAEKETGLKQPNYVLDFTNYGPVQEFQLRSLSSFLVQGGDVHIYISNAGDICGIGSGNSDVVHRALPVAVKSIFGEGCKLLINVVLGEEVKEVNFRDVSLLRLKL